MRSIFQGALAGLVFLLIASNVQAQTLICFKGTQGCVPGIQSTASVPISINTNTITQLVALNAAQRIIVTGFELAAAGASNAKFVYGTGTNCGTGTTDLTGLYTMTTSEVISRGNGLGGILFVPAGNALCISNSASVLVAGSLSYTQVQ